MDVEHAHRLSLAVAQERDINVVLKSTVDGLAGHPGVALARVWLVAPGDSCASCAMRPDCPNQTACLHLVAGAGGSLSGEEPPWRGINGRFRRFPIGVRKIGRIAADGAPILIRAVSEDVGWIADPQWSRRERIVSFAGQPLLFRGEVLGVLGMFSRVALDEQQMLWLRMFADHAAAAIANSRAFAEIERLRDQLAAENTFLREEVRGVLSADGVIAASPAFVAVLRQIELVAPTAATVLLMGETGTGKEVLARRLHEQSPRRQRPFITVNCAAIPRELFESEFFGHVKGSFTGALRDRLGRFQAADGGTLFLDEVGEIPLDMQPKLLRALQEGTVERVGEERARRVNVRMVAATNRDLRREVIEGRFREDLYYRLSVFPIVVPPLRERLDDIPALAQTFVRQAAQRLQVPEPSLTPAHFQLLHEYAWPGNVRELQNVIERAVIVGQGRMIAFDTTFGSTTVQVARASTSVQNGAFGFVPMSEWKERERANMEAALRKTGWRVAGKGGAAELLGMKPTTLASRIKALGIRREA